MCLDYSRRLSGKNFSADERIKAGSIRISLGTQGLVKQWKTCVERGRDYAEKCHISTFCSYITEGGEEEIEATF